LKQAEEKEEDGGGGGRGGGGACEEEDSISACLPLFLLKESKTYHSISMAIAQTVLHMGPLPSALAGLSPDLVACHNWQLPRHELQMQSGHKSLPYISLSLALTLYNAGSQKGV